MLCETARHWLLTADDAARPDPAVAAHLAGCPACTALVSELAGLEADVRAYPIPASILVRRDAFIANLSPRPARPVRVRHVAAVFAALAASVVACVALVALLRNPQKPDGPGPMLAQGDPALVADLVEWNLKLTEADEPDREKMVRDRLPELQAAVQSASLSKDDRVLAEQLLANGRKLGESADAVDAAEGFHDLADNLLVRLDRMADDPGRSEVYARLFSQVVDRGVDANLDRAERQALRADKQARVQNLKKAKKKQAAKAADMAERMPEPVREQVRGGRAKTKGPNRPPK